jgi:nucleotide-binding universal stress UspA family protein
MYKKIVVPLDGSKTAEIVLPHLEAIANGCGTQEVILVSVTEAMTGYTPYVQTNLPGPIPPPNPVLEVPHATGKKQTQAARYLARIAKKVRAKSCLVSMEVLVGNPAEEIIKLVTERQCDLIAIASHGRSGVDKWAHSIGAYGGVADKVLRASPVPVLLVKAV